MRSFLRGALATLPALSLGVASLLVATASSAEPPDERWSTRIEASGDLKNGGCPDLRVFREGLVEVFG